MSEGIAVRRARETRHKVVIVGGGMAGLVLARALIDRDVEPVVLERLPEDRRIPGPISRGVPVQHEQEVVELLRDGRRDAGARVRGPEGEREIASDLLVGADGTHSPVRTMAAIPAEVRPSPGAALSFRSPVLIEDSFRMAYQSDGRQVGLIGWAEGSAGWWQIDRVGREAALAPGVEAYRRGFARLLPEAAPALAGVTSIDQLVYREVTEVRCETWWTPGWR